jgi:hypothetical protein
MQSWSNTAQSGTDDHGSWQPGFEFAGQNGQFDHNQNWSQPMVDQGVYSHDAASSGFFESQSQQGSFLQPDLHGSSPNQAPFHGGHEPMALSQQFSQSAQQQQQVDPAFHNIHQDMYGQQQQKLNMNEGINHLGRAQPHAHPHGHGGHAHAQAFNQHEFGFASQNDQPYTPPVAQYSQPQIMSQPPRQKSHTPVQQFHADFVPNHGFSRPPQPSPVQQQTRQQPPAPQQQQPQHQPPKQQPQQQQQPFTHHTQAYPHQLNGHQAQYDLAFQQPQQHYSQAAFAPPKPHVYQQPSQAPTNPQLQQQFLQQQAALAGAHVGPAATPTQYGSAAHPVDLDSASAEAQEPSLKKRKRAIKAPSEPAYEPPITSAADSPAENSFRKPDEIDVFDVPVPNAAESQLLAQFNKRNKTAQARYPSITGLPHLVFDGTVKLPAPKSYDKLAPLVALPPRSGKQMVPELGYNLPCELQGRFTSQYRPSVNKVGLDDRRDEAKSLLDDFDKSMSSLGKRRPKYTEYPHAFKEQLKSDEASKNKAEKKAKKEQEEERSKPVGSDNKSSPPRTNNHQIRPPTRPADHVEAAVWDAVGIVHIEQDTPRTSSLVAGRVQQAGDFFIKLRGDMTRAKADLDQATKDQASDAEMAKLKQDAEQKKEALYRALDATIEHADDSVLDNLGGHQKLILSLVNVLIGCIKAGDFSGKLPKVVLELFTNFRMTRKIAETTNFETVRKRFSDRGDDDVKELARELAQKIKKVQKAAESDTGYSGTSAASRAKAAAKPATEGSSAKRGRDDEPDSRTIKKVAVESSSNSLFKKLGQSKPQPQPKPAASASLSSKARPLTKPSIKSEDVARHSPTPPTDDKTKPDSRTASAGMSTMAKAEALAAVAGRSGSMSSSSALSGIASLLDSINAPKAEPIAKIAKEPEAELDETPAQREKRLRKEARRKLRVSWKPEAELVQVKIFQKDDGEDEGREVNMIRDAGDDRSEGMVLKQRADVEDDDDDDDIPYQPWLEPTRTDFSSIPEAARNKNYVTRGGRVTFTTEEQRRIGEREQRELMAIYTDPDDIPPTPKSPPLEASSGSQQGKTVQLPREGAKYEEIHLRWRDEQQLGVDGALYAAVKRLDAKEGPSGKLDTIFGRLRGTPSSSVAPHQPATTANIPQNLNFRNVPLIVGPAADQVLAWFGSEQVKNWHEPEPVLGDLSRPYQYRDAEADVAGKGVEEAAKCLAGKPFPATSPPEWLLGNQEKVREWWRGYDKESLARQKKVDEERAKAEAEANAQRAAAAATAAAGNTTAQNNAQDWSAYYTQQQEYAPYMAILQQMTGNQQPGQAAAAAPSLPDNQLQSILAAMNQPAAQAQAANSASYLNPNDPSYQQLSMLMQMAQGSQNPEPQTNAGFGADRDWDRNDSYGRGDGHKEGKKKKSTLPPHKPANKALIGTKACTFWQQGKCARGDKCTFRHD